MQLLRSPHFEARTPARNKPLAAREPLRSSRGAAVLPEDAFRAMVHSELACLDRHGHPFSLISFDAARLDASGGDLSRFVRQAAALLRSTDLVARMGPEKAMVLLPFTERERAEELATVLLDGGAWAEHGMSHEIECPGPSPRVTIPARSGRTGPGFQQETLPEGLRWEQAGVPLLLGAELPRSKRAMDVFLAATGLVLLAPLMGLIALIIKVSYGGPVIFRQWRTGKGFRRFEIYKFRTMRPRSSDGWEDVQHLNEMSGPLFKSSNDPRVLRFGKLLRKASLDELPQLVNVLKGDMTLMGPRALSPLPSQYQRWQLRRFDMTPGVACEWQAERRSDTNFDAWMRSDLRYVGRGHSFLGDVRLLLATLKAVLRCAGGR